MRGEAREKAPRTARKARCSQAATLQSIRPNRVPNFSKSPLPGSWGVMLTCLRELGKKSKFSRLLHQSAISALAQCRTRRRIHIASSRSRQRQRRAETRSVIEALILGGLEQALNFDASCPERQIPGSARLLASQAAGLACREDPLEFKADKRGRSRQVFNSCVLGKPSATLSGLPFYQR